VRVADAGVLPVAAAAATPRAVTLGVRPADLRLSDTGLDATVELVEELGDSRIVNLQAGAHRMKLKSDAALAVSEGDRVRLAFAPEAAHQLDRASGERLN
jgi:ABC-type sugar transport system ATPase subunit